MIPFPHPAFFIRTALLVVALFLSTGTHAQLETRSGRDAAGARELLTSANETAPTLDEMSAAYDRASASWMEVFGPEPFFHARSGALRAAEGLSRLGWAPKARVAVAMLDIRGDAAWMDEDSCRAQLNVGSNGESPVSKALGHGSFEFLAAHELAHCLFDQTPPAARLPSAQLLERGPVSLTTAQIQALLAMISSSSWEDGSEALADSYDEALADQIAALSMLARDDAPRGAVENALALRMGAIALSLRRRAGLPVHLGAYGLWSLLARTNHAKAPSLEQARADALQSVLVHALSARDVPRWALAFKDADPSAFGASLASAKIANAPLKASRPTERDEDLYMSASLPALFIMDLGDSATSEAAQARAARKIDAEESMREWRANAWISVDSTPGP